MKREAGPTYTEISPYITAETEYLITRAIATSDQDADKFSAAGYYNGVGYIFTTDDGAATWTERNMPADIASGHSLIFTFIWPYNENDLVACSDTQVYYCTNLFSSGATSITWVNITYDVLTALTTTNSDLIGLVCIDVE